MTEDLSAGSPFVERPTALHDCVVDCYPDDVLRAATEQQLREALARDRAELIVAQKKIAPTNSDAAKRCQELELRLVQLQNALNRVESEEYWNAVMNGCSPEMTNAEETDPGIRHADALLREWQGGRRPEIESRMTALQREDISPDGQSFSHVGAYATDGNSGGKGKNQTLQVRF